MRIMALDVGNFNVLYGVVCVVMLCNNRKKPRDRHLGYNISPIKNKTKHKTKNKTSLKKIEKQEENNRAYRSN